MAAYSFADTHFSIQGPGGAFSLSEGGVADEGITFAMIEEKNTMTPGADGTIMHSLHASKAGKATLRLLKTSPINALLSQMYALQTANSALHGQNTLTLNDPHRGDVIAGNEVAFAKFPDVTFAKDGGMNEWEFHVGIMNQLLGSGTPDINVAA